MPTINIGLAEYPISSANVAGTGWMLNEKAKWTANTGMCKVDTANTGLDGGGTLGTLLTAASSGTFIKTVTIKSTTANTTQGMIRLFIYDGTNTRLLSEVEIEPVSNSSGALLTSVKVIPLNFNLNAGYVLKVSTEKAITFKVYAEGLDWTY